MSFSSSPYLAAVCDLRPIPFHPPRLSMTNQPTLSSDYRMCTAEAETTNILWTVKDMVLRSAPGFPGPISWTPPSFATSTSTIQASLVGHLGAAIEGGYCHDSGYTSCVFPCFFSLLSSSFISVCVCNDVVGVVSLLFSHCQITAFSPSSRLCSRPF